MRCVISVLLTLVVSVSAPAADSRASVTAYCKSLALNAGVAVTTNEVVTSAYFTTYDDRLVVPQHDALPSGLVRMSDELRPRTGQPGIYDVDYVVVSESDELLEYGSLMLRLSSHDGDTNGAADVLQTALPGNSEVTGTGRSDWPQQTDGTILGAIEREAAVNEGSFAITLARSNRVFISGSFSLPTITGEMEYLPSNPTQVVFRLTMTIAGRATPLTGAAHCSVPNANEITLDAFTLRNGQDHTRKVLPTVLRRVGTKFVGPLEFTDANPDTSWSDYVSWIVEIADSNDLNQNGVPDLSDTQIITDAVPPTVRISDPSNGEKLTDELVTVSGTARDNIGVARVEYRVGSGAFMPASGTTRWSATVRLAPGTNVVEVRAFDAKGNVSNSARRRVNYVTYAPLIFMVNGSGTVLPHSQGKELAVGRSHTLRAIPNPGHLFSHWSGDVEGQQASLTFVMQTNLAIIANFVPNPFLSLAGGYEGLFSETGTNRAESSGMLRLSLRPNGTYTGRLVSRGKTNAVVGRFQPNGGSTVTLRPGRPGEGSMTLQLQLDVAPGADALTGSLAGSGWTANVTGYRAAFAAGQNTNFASRYTIRIAGSGDGSQSPGGDGFATATVDANGKVKLLGKLADGTPFSFGTALSRSGAWPFFVATHRGKGVAMGWMRCASPPDIADASVTWVRPVLPTARYYPNGFTANSRVSGSAYTNGAFAFTAALVIASGGGLTTPVTNHLALAPDGRYTAADPSQASLKLNANSGAFTGSFISGGTSIRFEGVMLPKQNAGAGYFPGASSVGSIRVLPAP